MVEYCLFVRLQNVGQKLPATHQCTVIITQISQRVKPVYNGNITTVKGRVPFNTGPILRVCDIIDSVN
jgi:hypothetical protein